MRRRAGESLRLGQRKVGLEKVRRLVDQSEANEEGGKRARLQVHDADIMNHGRRGPSCVLSGQQAGPPEE